MKYSDTFSISLLCSTLNVSRSSFYHYFYYSKHDDRKSLIISRILSIFYDSKRTYGSPRIASVLIEEGLHISVKTVAKYMSLLGLVSIHKANYPKSKNKMSLEEKKLIINRIKNLDVIRPNQVWTTDITYIRTIDDGYVYLSSILDLFSRKVISWNVGYSMKKELVLETLSNAFKNRKSPINVIVHSDKGSKISFSRF